MSSAGEPEMWSGSRLELQELLRETGEELAAADGSTAKLVFFLAANGRLFGKREDGSWQEYDLPATSSS